MTEKLRSLPRLTNDLAPSMGEQIARARSDLAMGLHCIISNGAARAVIVAVEPLSDERLSALRDLFGSFEVVLTATRAGYLGGPFDAGQAVARIAAPAHANVAWCCALAHDSAATPSDMQLDWIGDAGSSLPAFAIDLIKSSELLPAVVLFPIAPNIPLPSELDFAQIVQARAYPFDVALDPVAQAGFPVKAHETSKLHVFRDADGVTQHTALVIGTPDPARPVLTRLHSACFTGDVLGSLKCDCGPQLRAAMAQMGAEGAGVLLYLNQEGRGIGLANKMRAYDLQSRGVDTVEANHRLGFDDDERDFRGAAQMLKVLGFDRVRLLTNNPAKVELLSQFGIKIEERLPLQVGQNRHNAHYLSVKAAKSGHLL